jgi:hypothetical protein
MKPSQIRQYWFHADWDGEFEAQRMKLIAEIAAQLAELNENLRTALAHPGTPKERV